MFTFEGSKGERFGVEAGGSLLCVLVVESVAYSICVGDCEGAAFFKSGAGEGEGVELKLSQWPHNINFTKEIEHVRSSFGLTSRDFVFFDSERKLYFLRNLQVTRGAEGTKKKKSLIVSPRRRDLSAHGTASYNVATSAKTDSFVTLPAPREPSTAQRLAGVFFPCFLFLFSSVARKQTSMPRSTRIGPPAWCTGSPRRACCETLTLWCGPATACGQPFAIFKSLLFF